MRSEAGAGIAGRTIAGDFGYDTEVRRKEYL